MDLTSANALEGYQRNQTQAVGETEALRAARQPRGEARQAAQAAADTLELSSRARVRPVADESAPTAANLSAGQPTSQARARTGQVSAAQGTDPRVAQTEADKAYGRAQQDVTQQVLTALDATARQQAATVNLYA